MPRNKNEYKVVEFIETEVLTREYLDTILSRFPFFIYTEDRNSLPGFLSGKLGEIEVYYGFLGISNTHKHEIDFFPPKGKRVSGLDFTDDFPMCPQKLMQDIPRNLRCKFIPKISSFGLKPFCKDYLEIMIYKFPFDESGWLKTLD